LEKKGEENLSDFEAMDEGGGDGCFQDVTCS
jgi:hypothetical protein